MRFRDLIYNKLYEKEMSQKELSKLSGVSESELSRIINGKRMPHVTTFYKICRVLDLDINEAFEGLKEDI